MIGEKLKQTRIKQGYSQTEVAKETNIYRPTLSKIENNIYEPNIEQLQKLIEFYNIDANWLIGTGIKK